MLRLRSWASSMMTMSYSSRSGSLRTSASSMPSVIILIRVSGAVRSWKRILQPTSRPHSTRSSSASRRDRERAATRRGWVQAMRAWRPKPASRHILGIWVVLPEPVSPAMMTTGCSLTAWTISSFQAVMGRSAGYESCGRRSSRCCRIWRERLACAAICSRSRCKAAGRRRLATERRWCRRLLSRTRSARRQSDRECSRAAAVSANEVEPMRILRESGTGSGDRHPVDAAMPGPIRDAPLAESCQASSSAAPLDGPRAVGCGMDAREVLG